AGRARPLSTLLAGAGVVEKEDAPVRGASWSPGEAEENLLLLRAEGKALYVGSLLAEADDNFGTAYALAAGAPGGPAIPPAGVRRGAGATPAAPGGNRGEVSRPARADVPPADGGRRGAWSA